MRMPLVISFYLSCFYTYAQEKIFEYELNGERQFLPRVCIIPQDNNTFFLSLAHQHDLSRFLISTQGQYKKILFQSELRKESNETFSHTGIIDGKLLAFYKRFRFIAGMSAKTKIIDVLKTNNTDDYWIVETDVPAATSRITDTLKVLWNEEFVFSFSRNNVLYLVDHVRRSNKFIVRAISPGAKPYVETISLNLPDSVISTAIASLHKKKEILVSQENLWLPINALDYRHRAYTRENEFIITLNNPDASTSAITIDLASFAQKIQNFPAYDSTVTVSNYSKGSCLLIDTLLINGHATNNALHINFFNLHTGKLIKKEVIDATNFNSQVGTSIGKVGDFWSKSNISEIGFDEFLKMCNRNSLVISGYKNGNQLHLTYGTKYNRTLTATFLANLVSLGVFSFSESKAEQMIGFNASYKLPETTPVTSSMNNFVWEKMLMFIWGKRDFINTMNLFYQKGYYLVGYYNPVIKKYFVHRFSEKVQ